MYTTFFICTQPNVICYIYKVDEFTKNIKAMKNIFLLLVSVTLFISCNNDDNTTTTDEASLVGNWQLIEVYSDPGDGSGTFQSVSSETALNFSANGTTVTSNKSFCNINNVFTATYSIENGTISLDECGALLPFTINVDFQRNELILSYPCIEACQYKYVKQ